MPPRAVILGLVALVIVSLSGCGNDPVGPGAEPGPGPGTVIELLVLNSTGQTLAGFTLSETLATDGPAIDLGAGFDGVSLSATPTRAATTVSAFGGSRVLFADLTTGAVQTTSFPAPEANAADPSRPTFDDAGTVVFVAGRGSDAIYAASPGDAVASRVATNVGTFVERVVPVGNELFALDAHLDDDGGTFAPLGPGRIFVLEAGTVSATIDLPPEAMSPIDMVRVGNRLLVLMGGTFDPVTFAPNGDGGLVSVDITARSAGPFVPLGGNGVAIEAGADGLVYVTSTTDFLTLDARVLNPAAGTGGSLPLAMRDAAGTKVDCWAVSALDDGRRVCITFDFASPGRLLVFDSDGEAVSEVPSGFGSTDLLLR